MSKTIAIVIKPGTPQAVEALERLVKVAPGHRFIMEAQGHHAVEDLPVGIDRLAAKDIENQADLMVVFGGDGTLIHAASLLQSRAVPILGVNVGYIGFMTDVAIDEVERSIGAALAGELAVTERMRLDVVLRFKDREPIHRLILNDAVLSLRQLSRLASYRVTVGDELMTTMRGDGVIVSTPTGSTAYAMAAGGSILSPTLRAIAVTPINPHQLTQRQMILDAEQTVTLSLDTETQVVATLDGQTAHSFNAEDLMLVRKADVPLRLFEVPWRSYFETLRTKLDWGNS